MSPTETTLNQTQEALLDAAEDLFSRRGYAAVGIREIAERAGANLASIRYHFGSKHELYLETVRRVMARGEADSAWTRIAEPPADASAAARLLAGFVREYLRGLLEDDAHESCCAMMLWEAVQPTEAIDSVVRDFITPGHESLLALIRPLLPEGESDALLHARSLLAQLLHYRVFRPFIERLPGDADTPPALDADRIARHITSYSLRAMGHDKNFIDDALQ